MGLIKKKEILYFEYFLKKAIAEDAVTKYAQTYDFSLYKDLSSRMKNSAMNCV